MKTEDQIRKRLRDLKARHLGRLLRTRLKRRPHNCHFNKEHTFDRDGKQIKVRLCMLGMERPDWDVDVCEKPEQAVTCPAFLLAETKDEVYEGFEDSLKDEETLRTKYKDLYALFWVLDDVQIPKYTLMQRVWLFLTAWWTQRSRQITSTEVLDDDDEDRG